VPLEALVEPHGICVLPFSRLPLHGPCKSCRRVGESKPRLGLVGGPGTAPEAAADRDKSQDLRVTPVMTQFGPMLQPSPMTTSATGVSMMVQLRLMKVEPPTRSRMP
jgi:hypothetical protein